VDEEQVSAHELSQVLGVIEFTATIFPSIRVLTRPLYDILIVALAEAVEADPEKLIRVSIHEVRNLTAKKWRQAPLLAPAETLVPLRLIQGIIHANKPVPVLRILKTAPGHCNIWFSTDASFEGIGGVNQKTGEKWSILFQGAFSLDRLGLSEVERSSQFPMMVLEALALIVHLIWELKRFKPITERECDKPFIFAYNDNQSLMYATNKLRTKGAMLKSVKVIAEMLEKHEAKIYVHYVESDRNVSDALSRGLDVQFDRTWRRVFGTRAPLCTWVEPVSFSRFFDIVNSIGLLQTGVRPGVFFSTLAIGGRSTVSLVCWVDR
jgi:hypothetical protein